MSRLIDADALMMMLADWWYSSFGQEETDEAKAIRAVMDEVERYINQMPPAEPEITHCKNCKYFEANIGGYEYGHYEYCRKWGRETNSDWYCSRGKS